MSTDHFEPHSVEARTLHAVRALGILLVNGTFAALIGSLVVLTGLGITAIFVRVPALVVFGIIVVGVGVVVSAVWQISIIVEAKLELEKSNDVRPSESGHPAVDVKLELEKSNDVRPSESGQSARTGLWEWLGFGPAVRHHDESDQSADRNS